MARKAPMAEQQAKAEQRREQFADLAWAVAQMTDDERAALVARLGAIVTVEGHPLTVHNSCLILTQLPTASMIGFRQWIAHGRCVRKGERGLMIWVPIGRGATAAPGGTETETETETETTGIVSTAGDKTRGGFVMGTVFDVSQTDPTNEGEAVAG